MEIVVKCVCGSKYRFNEEPIDGKLGHPVSCPNCGANGTFTANEYIRKYLSGELERERQHNNVWWRRLIRRKSDDDENEGPSRASDVLPMSDPGNPIFGVIGALAGGFAGMMGWFYLVKHTLGLGGRLYGLVAIVVGALAGCGARLFVRNGSFAMASVAGLVALLAIMGGQFLVSQSWLDIRLNLATKRAYQEMQNYAREAGEAETDNDIRDLIAGYDMSPNDAAKGEKIILAEKRFMQKFAMEFREFMPEGTGPKLKDLMRKKERDPDKILESEIAAFREKEMPELAAFLEGKPSEKEFRTALRNTLESKFSLHSMLLQSWDPYQLLFLVFGVVAAYKIAYNRSETEDV